MLSLAGRATSRLESELQTRALPGFIPVRKVYPNLTALHYGKMLTLKKKKNYTKTSNYSRCPVSFPNSSAGAHKSIAATHGI